MSTPVMPKSLIVYKMVKDYESTNKTQFTVSELYTFAHKALKIASEIDNEEYWILSSNKYGTDFCEELSKICDIDADHYQLNVNKFENGGQEYAKRIIGAMPYSFLKGAVQVMKEEMGQVKIEDATI